MDDAALMAEEVADGNGFPFVWEFGDVFSDVVVEFEFAGLDELECGDGVDGFGDGGPAVHGAIGDGDEFFAILESESV